MPVATCKNCGRLTNSACSDFWEQLAKTMVAVGEVKPTKCYAAYVDGKWVKGCAFDKAPPFEKKFAIGLIK